MKNEAFASQFPLGAWKAQPLAKIAEVFTDGDWIESKDQADSGVRLIQTGNVGIGQFKDRSEKARFIDEATFSRLKCFEVIPGDLLISRLPDPVGRACIVPDTAQKMITAVDCSIVRVQQASIDPKFFVYYSQTQEYLRAVDDLCSGTTRRRISRKNLGNVPVPLPPLDEQKRIVAILDKAFAALDRARALAEANLADAGALFVQVAQDNLKTIAVKGEMARVGDIADHCLGKMLDKSKNKGTFRPYLRNINVRWFEVDTSDVLEMRIEDRELDRYQVHKGDLLICEGGYPGRASIYQSDEPTYFQKALHRVRFDDESQAKVLMYWLFVEDKLGRLKDHFSGTGISHFTGKALAAYPMPVADPATTARAIHNIDKCLEKTTDLVSSYQAKLTDLANLRQSLLQKAFSGQLT